MVLIHEWDLSPENREGLALHTPTPTLFHPYPLPWGYAIPLKNPNADRKRSDVPEYKIGDKVWLSTTNLNIKRPTKKLAEKQVGPYEILEIISSNAVWLKLPKSLTIHPVVNVSSIRPYRAPAFKGQKADEPAPVEINEKGESYEVERILDSRRHRGKLEFLVKWKGYTAEHNSFESEADVENAKARVKQFYKENPGAIRRLRREVFDAIPWRNMENFTEGDADKKQVLFSWLDVHPEE
ncbi:hypothetical protein M378DRAFT_15702 [Amanita muscaria Koide BX008]|uniref:Chromo domain-containing protein n=1 Tax=Amanita muscaria (strain Koide BX008) TaxID=946122 RepID=A0A0C2WNB1_AMAMK|nr:hypothetical protein M378DRAFT_15702 [Amanita muscaria Koide BX008]